MKKTLAVPSVHYKGTGWARKDRAAGSRTVQTAAKESGSNSAGPDPATASASDSASAPGSATATSKDPD
jgi:predicted nucleic acid-binding Zn ribbon protein